MTESVILPLAGSANAALVRRKMLDTVQAMLLNSAMTDSSLFCLTIVEPWLTIEKARRASTLLAGGCHERISSGFHVAGITGGNSNYCRPRLDVHGHGLPNLEQRPRHAGSTRDRPVGPRYGSVQDEVWHIPTQHHHLE